MINLGDRTTLSFLFIFFLTYTVSSSCGLLHGWNLAASESTLPIVLNMRLGMNVPKSLAGLILNSSENSGWQQIPFAWGRCCWSIRGRFFGRPVCAISIVLSLQGQMGSTGARLGPFSHWLCPKVQGNPSIFLIVHQHCCLRVSPEGMLWRVSIVALFGEFGFRSFSEPLLTHRVIGGATEVSCLTVYFIEASPGAAGTGSSWKFEVCPSPVVF